jgi:hypothetical protein
MQTRRMLASNFFAPESVHEAQVRIDGPMGVNCAVWV